MTICDVGYNKAINGGSKTVDIEKDFIYSAPVKIGNKEFISNIFLEIETKIGKNPFLLLVPKGYRYPTVKELDDLCNEHPFFEQAINIKTGHIFINDLGLSIWTLNFYDRWSGCLYGPLCLCQESIDKMNIENDKYSIIEECYDIRKKEYKEWFDWRVPRHAIFVRDLD